MEKNVYIENVMEKTKKLLVEEIEMHKKFYREGTPSISDEKYDELLKTLSEFDPNHELLTTVEEENFEKEKIKHSKQMLSIQKAFSKDELKKWFDSIERKHGKLKYRVTPKLDGMAAKYENGILATRGDGQTGYNITDAFDKGLLPDGELKVESVGEIVMSKKYFEENLTEYFEHPRNCIVGAIKCDTLSPIQKKTMDDGAIKFIDYKVLPNFTGDSTQILTLLEDIIDGLSTIDYPIDGYVIEVTEDFPEVIEQLGFTSHHYKYQIAYKIQGEKKQTTVNDITWQVGRGGNITPVLEVEPVIVSGAKISRVTGHNYGYLKKKGIGIRTKIEIIRSGEVIPKVIGVVSDENDAPYVNNCPVCFEETVLVNDIIKCPNFYCTAQISGRIDYFFKTMKIDLFGIKTIDRLVEFEFNSIEDILDMVEEDYMNIGFGEKQSENFVSSVHYALMDDFEDWRILASVSIPLLGKGDSKKLLKHYYINELFDLTIKDITKLEGFGEKKAESIIYGLGANKELIEYLLECFMLTHTKDEEADKSDVLEGKSFVFTGKMDKPREEMMKLCEQNGGFSQKSLTKKTDYLILGTKVGKSKTEKAKGYGTKMLTEEEFFDMIK